MNSMPDAIVQHFVSLLSNARDIAACACVSKRWKEATCFIPSLYFPRNSFDTVPCAEADVTIGRMISSAFRLEELVIYCPFLASSLGSWLASCSRSLRVLELRMDCAADKAVRDGAGPNRLDCIDVAKGLEALKLWGVSLTRSPNWGSFNRLRTLEIIGATLRDSVLKDAVHACPNLTDLALLGCDGAGSVSIELERLEKCRLDFLGTGNCSLFLSSPTLQALEIQGFSWVRVNQNHCLRSLD